MKETPTEEEKMDWVFDNIGKLMLTVVFIIVAVWIALGITCVHVIGEVEEQGLSNVIEEVWVGTDTTATIGE